MPSLRRKAINIITDILENTLNNKSADPRAWNKKYLIEASISWFDEEINIRGIKEIKLNSRANQTIIQWELESAIKVLIKSEEAKNII